MSELKPCPFCGGEAFVNDDPTGNGGKPHTSGNVGLGRLWSVECDECGADAGFWQDRDVAIAAWNTRHHFGLTDEDYNILLDEMGVSERTCCMTDRGECSECGAYIVRAWTEVHDFNGDMKRIDLRSHSYCPNCGAKVVEE